MNPIGTFRLSEARASFPSHLLKDGYDIRTPRERLGHSDVRTTMISTHVMNQGPMGVKSPYHPSVWLPPLTKRGGTAQGNRAM